ncbi:MAG: hypothetical protein H0T45_09935, partial [Pyrinomonadaceae bacterium]|nr:hypothetical protein [Pyrinomonadaceae bacterium]
MQIVKFIAGLIFWSSVATLIYTYIGYPLLLAAVSRLRARPVRRQVSWTPVVTIIITAYNEELDL